MRQVKQGNGALIALDPKAEIVREVTDFLERFKPSNVCHLADKRLGSAPPSGKLTELRATSADQAAVVLATTFWASSQRAVFCREDDYASALVASTLAARLRVPLFFTTATAYSAETTAVIRKLGICEGLFVGKMPKNFKMRELNGVESVIAWLKSQGAATPYLAVANARDRSATTVQRLSLAAPMFAAAHDGMVVPVDVEVQWRRPFKGEPITGKLPKGIKAEGIKQPRAGVIELAEGKVPFVVGVGEQEKQYKLWLDLNGDGSFDGPGEGPLERDGVVTLLGKTRVLNFCEKFGSPSDVTVTTGSADEVLARLKKIYAEAGIPPYLCLVGFPDAIPQVILSQGNIAQSNSDMTSDLPYANTDEDLFSEIAVGRVIAESATFATLHASRCLVYPRLVNPVWSGRAGQACWEKSLGAYFENMGLNASAYHRTEDLPVIRPTAGAKPGQGNPERAHSFGAESPLANVGFIAHSEHSSWIEMGHTYDQYAETLIAPAVVESSGCSTCALDGEPGFRSVVARLLRNGAVSFSGQTRNGIAQQEQQRVEFWNGIFAGETIGDAHRRAQNSKAALVLETGQSRGGGDFYQLHIRTLFGDPAFKPQLPTAPRSAAARVETKGDVVTVRAPQTWWPVQIKVPEDWKQWADKPLYVVRGLGTYPNRRWCKEEYDQEETYVDTFVTTSKRIKAIEQVQTLPAPLGWTGKHVADEHADGSRTYHWRVRLINFDQKTGTIIQKADSIDFRLKYE